MADTDKVRVKLGLTYQYGQFGAAAAAAQASLDSQRLYQRTTPVDAAAATNGRFKVFVADRACKVIAMRVWSDATIAFNGANFVTATVVSDNDAAGGDTLVSTAAGVATSAANLNAGQSQAMPLNATAGQLVLAAGQSVYLITTKSGTGVTGGPYGLQVTVEDI